MKYQTAICGRHPSHPRKLDRFLTKNSTFVFCAALHRNNLRKPDNKIGRLSVLFTQRKSCLAVSRCGFAMKPKKKKLALPRRKWTINPATRVKESDTKYSRPRVKGQVRKYEE
jgi:hypothetical protein